ncbi:MAG: DNA cytosine methyltransferase [Candidatus Margulisbacteria bacterium]|nr:DNA cytosine methyltransferase [Candidatus Margulisiibacteriota bacterium]
MKNKSRKYPSISLFTGAFGLDLGLEKAGFDVMACVEKDSTAVQTILQNKPELKNHIIEEDINYVSPKQILKIAGFKRGEVALVSGGPPCQPFSTVGRRHSISSTEGLLFKKFLDVVWGVYPKFFIFENVKGILSAAIQHRPISKRTSKVNLCKEEVLGSAWHFIKKEFDFKLRRGKTNGYEIYTWELNAADYGVAQKRRRVFVIGVRGARTVRKPRARFKNSHIPIKKVIAYLENTHEIKGVDYSPYDEARYAIFSEGLIKAGQNWKDLPIHLQKKIMGKGWYATGGKVGFCRRLSWDKPSPTITTNPKGRATNICHPSKPRPLTYRECALIQGFPETWKFSGSLSSKYRQIGNAVPIQLGATIGKALIRSLKNDNDPSDNIKGDSI